MLMSSSNATGSFGILSWLMMAANAKFAEIRWNLLVSKKVLLLFQPF